MIKKIGIKNIGITLIKSTKILSFLVLIVFFLTSCKQIIRITNKNEDFEYLQNGQVAKVIIQSTRDKGFRFMVTDPDTIKELYNSLSTALPAKERNPMEPDYQFEFHTINNEVKKYYYVAGTSNNEGKGNLYNETNQYSVINRIDNKIIKNLNVLRKPINFSEAYYDSILDAVKAVRADNITGTIGVIINEDKEMLKYQMSFELKDFERNLSQRDAKIINQPTDGLILMKVKTSGYKTDFIKCVVEVKDPSTRKTKTFYVRGKYIDGTWNREVFGSRPSDW